MAVIMVADNQWLDTASGRYGTMDDMGNFIPQLSEAGYSYVPESMLASVAPKQIETNLAGNIQRIHRDLLGGAFPDQFYGGAGAQHEYAFKMLDPATGQWNWWNPGEHNEESIYRWAGLNSQEYKDAYDRVMSGVGSPLDVARVQMPGAFGQALTRTDQSLTGSGGSTDDNATNFRQELAFYMSDPTIRSGLEQYYTPGMLSQIQSQLESSSASAQASRDPGGNPLGDVMGFLSDLPAPLKIAAAMYGLNSYGMLPGSEAANTWNPLTDGYGMGPYDTGATAFPVTSAGSPTMIDGLSQLPTGLPYGQTMALPGEVAAAGAAGAAGAGAAASPGMLGSLASSINSALGTNFTGGELGSLLSSGASIAGGLLSGNAAHDAAQTSANAQLEAARIAADAARFKPVGVTTNFGQSRFTTDAQGNVTSAGYTLSPQLQALQNQLMGAAPGMLNQFTGSQATTAPMGTAAQAAMNLGNQYLATSPQAQAQKYYDDQQAVMAAQRERDRVNLENRLMQQGRLGLATGGTSGGMMAANPEMEALYNAQRQQDLQLAAAATQGGMDYAKFGAGMVGTGGDLLKSMYGTQTAAFDPYRTALGGAQTIEGMGQNALDLSINLGKTASPAQSGQLLAQGMLGAAQTMQPANSYSPWGALLSGAGNTLQNYQNQQAQQQQQQQFLNALSQGKWV